MSIAISHSAQLTGLRSEVITIEVDISNGLHAFSIVGLGDRSVDEARDRVSAAIKNSGYVSPKQKNQKVVISLAPADVRKEGPSFDLAMAVAYLAASEEIELDPERKLFLGELSLDGSIRKVSGILPILCQAAAQGFTSVFIPKSNESEAALARDITIYAVSNLKELIEHIKNIQRIAPTLPRAPNLNHENNTGMSTPHEHDLSMIRGNESAKRGLEIAAAGAHNIVMSGPPGTGKTMLAQSFGSILPALSYEQSIEVTSIHSAAKTLREDLIAYPPFRAPHHTASYPAVIGGGSFPKPGEVTLAHRGILFLDEFPEFNREVIEALRQPLEDRSITISRARGVVTFPAQCILVASMNPCPCGLGKDKGCKCSEKLIAAYKRKISGPIMDRIDIWVNVTKIDYAKLAQRSLIVENSATVRSRVQSARARQQARFKKKGLAICYNSEMDAKNIESCIQMTEDARSTLRFSAERLGLSGRAFHRIIKVSQTIADLAGVEEIKKDFILEAIQYREKI